MTQQRLNLRISRRAQAQAALSRALDLLFAPVISRLTDEEYFSCKTRSDCVRAYLGRTA